MLDRKARQALAKDTKAATPNILRHTPGCSTESKKYTDLLPALPPKPKSQIKPTTIRIENADTLTAAQNLHSSSWSSKPKIGVMNMASDAHAGGGWLRGALAQEEALCLRSTLAATLKQSYYPFTTPSTAIWSPGVVVFRDEIGADCAMLPPEERFVVSVVSIAGIRRPKLSSDELDYCATLGPRYNAILSNLLTGLPKDIQDMGNKVRQTLRIFATHKVRSIVLGALGCGVFANPPKRVARDFKKVIKEKEFEGYFDEVVFAILDIRGSHNQEIFSEVFEIT